jgi:catechol 2,3-dioxygenase-like lactoylglutathione lyase family enzyme
MSRWVSPTSTAVAAFTTQSCVRLASSVSLISARAAGAHICFRAPDRAAVDAFHTAALACGGRDDGAPGLRPNYHAHYYGAFVLDPDGHRIEAVCHAPTSPTIVASG